MRVVNVRNSSGYFLPSGEKKQDKNLLKMYLNARVGFIPFKVNGCSLSHLLTFKIDKMQFAVLFLVVSAVWLCRFH